MSWPSSEKSFTSLSTSQTVQGVFGWSLGNAGVVGESTKLHGVFGVCRNPHGAGVFGTNDKSGGFGEQGVEPRGTRTPSPNYSVASP